MSLVSTVIVSVPALDYDGEARRLLLDKDMNELWQGCSGGKLVADDNDWGGTKGIQVELLIGGFNYLNENALLRYIAGLPWADPEFVQVFIKSEHSPVFVIYTGVREIRRVSTWNS